MGQNYSIKVNNFTFWFHLGEIFPLRTEKWVRKNLKKAKKGLTLRKLCDIIPKHREEKLAELNYIVSQVDTAHAKVAELV